MTTPNVDHVLVGVVFAFDAETGDVLHIHEKFVETVDGKPAYPAEITPDECEEIRVEATRTYPRRRIDAIIAPPEMAQRRGVRYLVDPMTREVREEPECDPGFEARLEAP